MLEGGVQVASFANEESLLSGRGWGAYARCGRKKGDTALDYDDGDRVADRRSCLLELVANGVDV